MVLLSTVLKSYDYYKSCIIKDFVYNSTSVHFFPVRKYQLGKIWFFLDTAVGQPYGSCFEAKGNKLTKVLMEADGDTEISKYIDSNVIATISFNKF